MRTADGKRTSKTSGQRQQTAEKTGPSHNIDRLSTWNLWAGQVAKKSKLFFLGSKERDRTERET
jgi:hypothetical protein